MSTILDFLMAELERIRSEVDQMERKLQQFETAPFFDQNDIRYLRVIEEKKTLQTHLCALRLQLLNHDKDPKRPRSFEQNFSPDMEIENSDDSIAKLLGKSKKNVNDVYAKPVHSQLQGGFQNHIMGFQAFAPEAKVVTETASKLDQLIDNKEKYTFNFAQSEQPKLFPFPTSTNSTSNPTTTYPLPTPTDHFFPTNSTTPMASVAPSSTTVSNTTSISQRFVSGSLPALQLEEYLDAKKELARIMRDFSNNKLLFVAHDDTPINPYQYQMISPRIKYQGEIISQHLKGKDLVFVTGIDKKKKTVTENKLFMPDTMPVK